MDAGDQLAVTCPACSPTVETVHEVLSPGGHPTVRCRSCGHVHSTRIDADTDERTIRTIVSQEGDSVAATVEAPVDAVLDVGDRFVVDTDEAVYSVELTAIEDRHGRRHERLSADQAETLWTRDIGNVAVRVTIHPPRGSGQSSRAATLRLPGDTELSIGEERRIDGERVRLTGILLRTSAVEARADRKLDRAGASAMAMDIDRVYARSPRATPRDPW